MSFRILSAILRQTWAIDERYALAHGWLVSNILQGLEFKANPSAQLLPKRIQTGAKPSGKEYVSIIPIHGVLMKYDQDDLCDMAAGTLTMGHWIREAASDPEVKAIILDIDTPGGTADGTQLLANTIAKITKPVIAHSNGLIASAGYWIASATDEIWVSDNTTEIGSIGVQTSFADMRPMWEKEGVKFHLIRADQSKDKNEEFVQALDSNYDLIKKESLNPLAAIFIEAVKVNRSGKLTNADKVTTGKVFFASDALNLGLIDKIGSLEEAISRALELSDDKQQTPYKKQQTTMEKYPQITKHAGTELEASEEGLFLTPEIAQAIDQSLADAETQKTELETSVASIQAKLDDQALAAQQANSELENANKTIQDLNDRIAELEKHPADTGGGASIEADTYDDKPTTFTDSEAKALYQIRQSNFGNNK
jgi:signal peptide peptidase SppA